VLAGLDKQEHTPFDLARMFNFSGPRDPKVILDPSTGQPVYRGHHRHRW
jgi:hypothetical protein